MKFDNVVITPHIAGVSDGIPARRVELTKELEEKLAESEDFRKGGGIMLLPPHPYSPLESITVPGDPPPSRPSRGRRSPRTRSRGP